MRHIMITLAALSLLACDPPQSGSAQQSSNPETQTQTTDPPAKTASLELAFMSGHLGNTWDCPGKGVALSQSAGKADAPESYAGAAREDCGEDCSNLLLNCESASLMLQVTNTGEVALTNFQVTDLELLDLDQKLMAALQVIDLQVVMKGDALEPGGTAQLRIELSAPESQDLGHNGRALLRAIVVSAEDADGEIITPEVSGLGLIAT